MSSDPARARLRAALGLLALALGPVVLALGPVVLALGPVVLATGCGHRGHPVAPAPSLPATPREARFRQRGGALDAAATYPVERLGPRRLKPPAAPALLYLVPRSPGDLTGWDTPAREREFVRDAGAWGFPAFDDAAVGSSVSRVDTLVLEKLGEPRVHPSRRHLQPLPGAGAATTETPKAVVVAVALEDAIGRSLPSARAVLRPVVPPLPALQGFAATPEETGVRLAWTPPADTRAPKVAVWRRLASESEAWDPWRVVDASAGSLLDETARYGDDLVYAAAALREATGGEAGEVPAISEFSRVDTIAFRDVFPPLPPSDLDAVAEAGAVRVFWFPGGSADEARARVERQVEAAPGPAGRAAPDPAGRAAPDPTGSAAPQPADSAAPEPPWTPVAVVDAPESYALDRDVVPERRYRYRVTVEDRAGNPAAPAGPSPWVSPRPPEPPPAAPGPGAGR